MVQLLTTLLVTFILSGGPYCEGWEEGYKEGWCYDEGDACLEPLVPICPTPKLDESHDSYKDGYNRGFTKGKKDKKEEIDPVYFTK